jgi:hypothetical protein
MPPSDKLSYDVFLTAIYHHKWSFNFEFSDGTRSDWESPEALQKCEIPPNTPISKILIHYD